TDVCPRASGIHPLRNHYAVARQRAPDSDGCRTSGVSGSGMGGLAVSPRMRAAGDPGRRTLWRPPGRCTLARSRLTGGARAPLQASLQGRHQVNDIASGLGPRLGDRDVPALHLPLDRLLDPRLDLIRKSGRVESVRALLLDELPG